MCFPLVSPSVKTPVVFSSVSRHNACDSHASFHRIRRLPRFPWYGVTLHVLHYKNLPRLCTGTGKSTRVSKICSPRRGLPSRGRCKSLTRGWIFLSLYKVVVDYFSPTALNPHDRSPLLFSKSTSKRFLVRKRRQLRLIMTSRHCMIYDVTRRLLKRSCLYRGR